jgi:hypothetical protein
MADQVPSMSQNTNGNAHILQPQARSARPLVLGSPPALGLGAAPAIDIESTDGSGNGSPVGGPIVSAPMGRLDSTRSWTGFLSPDPNAMDQHNHAPSTSPSIYAEIHLGPSSRPPPVSQCPR